MISFTEEMVMNRDAIPRGIPKDWRYYRCEIHQPFGFPVEHGYLWLPPHIDISKIEDIINVPPIND